MMNLIDTHIHGGFGIDIMTANKSDILFLSKKLVQTGVKWWTPTLIGSNDISLMRERMQIIANAAEEDSSIIGVHIEGPFISPDKKGILPSKSIIPCDKKYYDELSAYGLPLRFTLAPEADNAISFIEYVTNRGGAVTLGHSDDDGTKTKQAIAVGATGFTHLFNAMRSIHHRNGSIALTALLSDLPCEIIADFKHISADCLNLAYKMKGLDGIVLVTDAMQAMNSNIGHYNFCGSNVYFDGETVRDINGTLAGSTLSLDNAVENFSAITKEDKTLIAEKSLENSLRMIRVKL